MNFYGKKYLAFIELLASQIQQKLKTASANVWNSWNSDIQAIYANKLKFRLHRLDRNTELYYFFSFLDSMIFLLCQLCHYAFCTRMVYMRRSVMFCILKISKKVSNSAVCMIGHDFCSVLCCWCCHLNRLVSNLILNGFFWFSLGVLSSLKPKNNKIHF